MPVARGAFLQPWRAAVAYLPVSYRRAAQRWPALPYLAVFSGSGLLSAWLHTTPTFADPDSFYHAKMALLLRDHGVFTTFPWLQFTVLRDSFADHQFLYHLLLVPFTAWLPPLDGVKLATVVFFAAAVTAFYALLRCWRVRWAWLPTAVLLVSNPFLFRANLAKAQALTLVLLFAALAALTRRRAAMLAPLAAIYVWLHAGWPLLPVLAVLYLSCSLVLRFAPRATAIRQRAPIRPAVALLVASVAGAAVGLVVNPYFPRNLRFYWDQIVQIALINYQELIGVGGEWYPYDPLALLAATSLATLLFGVALMLYALTIRRQPVASTFLLAVTLLLYGLTVRSRRNVEYLVPFGLLFAGLAVDRALRGLPIAAFWRELKQMLLQRKLFLAAAVLPLLLFPYIVGRDVYAVWDANAASFRFRQFREAATWLAQHSPPASLVFHSDWDEFPLLFYHNSRNTYVVGLDPTFMYRFSPARYWEWERVTTGRERARLYEIVAVRFGARYVLVGTDHEPMRKLAAAERGFREVYRDGDAVVFEVLPTSEIRNPKHQFPNNIQ